MIALLSEFEKKLAAVDKKMYSSEQCGIASKEITTAEL